MQFERSHSRSSTPKTTITPAAVPRTTAPKELTQ